MTATPDEPDHAAEPEPPRSLTMPGDGLLGAGWALVRDPDGTPRSPLLAELPLSAAGLLGAAYGLILSAGDGDWTREHPQWAEAARRWTDRYREYLADPAPRD